MKKNIAILGSTGSIGRQTIEVVRNLKLNVIALTAYSNVELLAQQALEFMPEMVFIERDDKLDYLKDKLKNTGIKILSKEDAIDEIVNSKADIVLNSIVGTAGIIPTVKAIEAGKDIALANKETLVAGGKCITNLAEEKGVNIFPVDSEHSAIFQSLEEENIDNVEKIIITASGGPFREKSIEGMYDVTVEDALNHPTWNMGRKITIDSATLMNKGLEVIEAARLFNVGSDKIEVVIHPQSLIHSMVQYQDGSIIAQLGNADMRIPIQYAITYPVRAKNNFERLDFYKVGQMTFFKPDMEKFKCLKLAFDALDIDGTMPAVLNAANEEAVKMFLNSEIGFMDIAKYVEEVMNLHTVNSNPTIDDILAADKWARDQLVKKVLEAN